MNREKVCNNQRKLLDRCNYSIGISVGLRDAKKDMVLGIFDPIILKGSKLPCRRSKAYYTLYNNQRSTEIKIYQGNSKYADDNLLIGKFNLRDIPKSPAGRQKIELIFSYSPHGILDITAKVLSTGKVFKTIINTLEKDKDIVFFEESMEYDNWQKCELAYMVKAVIRYAEEKMNDMNPKEAEKMDIVLRRIKRYLYLNDEKMIEKHKKELIYLLSQAG